MSDHLHPSVARVIDQLESRRNDALSTLELLQGYRHQVEDGEAALESPQAVLEYIDFFTDMVARASENCEGIRAELVDTVSPAHVETLRRIARDSAAEQHRCLLFRDRWINKPLPEERMRPLLNEISVTTRDQLTAFRDLDNAAASLEELLMPGANEHAASEKKPFDRRALFTRLFRAIDPTGHETTKIRKDIRVLLRDFLISSPVMSEGALLSGTARAASRR